MLSKTEYIPYLYILHEDGSKILFRKPKILEKEPGDVKHMNI
jgi:hypothetical protein